MKQANHLPSLNRALLNLICATTPPHINNWNSEEGNYSRVIATAVVDEGRGMKREGVHSWWISHSSSWLRLFLPTTFKPTAAPYKICCISEWIPRALLGSPSAPATFINQELVKKRTGKTWQLISAVWFLWHLYSSALYQFSTVFSYSIQPTTVYN